MLFARMSRFLPVLSVEAVVEERKIVARLTGG